MPHDSILIFTDGASRGNPGPGGWAAILLKNKESEVVEIGGYEPNTTNNRMELMAAIKALTLIPNSKFLIQIYTDSSYLINGITKWLSAWRINNWRTKNKKAVLNRELWEELAALTENKNIEWKYVGGHAGVAANERADQIATSFADSKKPKLYHGPLSKYGTDVLNFKIDEHKSTEKRASRLRSRQAAYSYVSLLDGKIKIHKSWADCERRVKGKSGARFKKATSKEEQEDIIKELINNLILYL